MQKKENGIILLHVMKMILQLILGIMKKKL